MILLHSEGTIKQTLEAFLITPLTGATGVRLAADIPFQATTGEVHPAGDAERNYGPVVLIEQAEGVVVPSMEVDSTDDSNEPNATYTLYIVNSKGKEIGTVFERWIFSASLGEAITYGRLEAFNLRHLPLRDQETYTRIGTNILVQEAVGDRAFGNEVDAGILLLDVPPIDPTNPEAVGANSWAATDHTGIAASSYPHLVSSAPIHVSDNDPRINAPLGVFNVKAPAYSAVGNGTTDDTAAIQAALTAAGIVGGTVYFPATANGYLVTDGLQIPSNVTLMGDGYRSQIKCPANGWNITVDGSVRYGILNIRGTSNIRITGLRITGMRTLIVDATCDGGFPGFCHSPKLVSVDGNIAPVSNIMVDHCWFEEALWEGFNIISGADLTTKVTVSDNFFNNIDGPSAITINAHQSVISDNLITNCKFGIGIVGNKNTVTGNLIVDAVAQGIGVGEFAELGLTTITGNVISLTPASGSQYSGILVIGSASTTYHNKIISGNVIRINNNPAIGGAGGGIRVYAGGGHTDVTGNSIEINGASQGVVVDDTFGPVNITNNTVRVENELTGNIGFLARATTAGRTLFLVSSNNRVFGITRANSGYAYDYRLFAGLGTFSAIMSNDFKTEGSLIIGDLVYPASGITFDNIPISLSTNLASWGKYAQAAQFGMVSFEVARTVNIVGGVIDISGSTGNIANRRTRYIVGTEGSAASDDLDTISGGQDGDILILGSVSDIRDVVFKNATGNLNIGTDFTLLTTKDRIVLMYDAALSTWVQISRNTN